MTYRSRGSDDACVRCCPARVYYALRDERRVPTVFHADDNCAKLPFEHRGQDDRLGVIVWPDWRYDEIMRADEAWERCRECIPDAAVLRHLGDSRRPNPWAKVGRWIEPGVVRSLDAQRGNRRPRRAA